MKNEKLFVDLSDEQSEKVVGGVGVGDAPGAGIAGWFGNGNAADGDQGLVGAGFTAPGVQHTPGSTSLTVTIPQVPPGVA